MTSTAVVPSPFAFEYTPAHDVIFAAIREGAENLQISSVAGSGKTSTILESLKFIPRTKSVLVLAFNKRIAVELDGRCKSMGLTNVTVKTLNALGHGAYCMSQGGFKSVTVDAKKVDDLCAKWVTGDDRDFRPTVARMVRLAKAAGMIPVGVPGAVRGLVEDTVEQWTTMVEHHDVDVPGGATIAVLIDLARRVLRESLKIKSVIDFDDQLLHTFAYAVAMKRYDFVFVDESQDLSPLQHVLVSKAVKPNGRVVSVGDECQAIYGFRGADADSMAKMAKQFGMKQLPLHVSYRCPQSVVALAQKYVSHIKSHPSAPMGTVDLSNKDFRDVLDLMRSGDMVVSRFNAPLVKIAFSLLRARIPCVLLGRDIGAGLMALVRKLRATDIPMLLERLANWRDAEVSRYEQANNQSAAEQVADKVEALRVFCEGSDSVAAVLSSIERMFSDQSTANVVTLCSIHKAKGLEARKVWAVNFGVIPRFATKEWMLKQERNLVYVQVTRAKETFVTISVPRNENRA